MLASRSTGLFTKGMALRTGASQAASEAAATPKPILVKLHSQITDVLRMPDVAGAITKQGAEVEGGTADEFRKYLISEIAKWSKVIKAAGVQP